MLFNAHIARSRRAVSWFYNVLCSKYTLNLMAWSERCCCFSLSLLIRHSLHGRKWENAYITYTMFFHFIYLYFFAILVCECLVFTVGSFSDCSNLFTSRFFRSSLSLRTVCKQLKMAKNAKLLLYFWNGINMAIFAAFCAHAVLNFNLCATKITANVRLGSCCSFFVGRAEWRNKRRRNLPNRIWKWTSAIHSE